MVDAAQRLCEESDSVSLTTPLATTIIKVYCRIGKFDDAIKLYAKMNFSHSTTVPALVIINELTNASRYDEARTIVESLDPDVVRTSLELTSTIIKLYCRCNRIDLAMKLFHKLTPDAHVYNILISALVNAGKLDDAQQLVDSMHNHKFPPSVELTTTLIKLACKKKNFEQAVALFNKVSPTAHTYNVLISALIDDQEFSMAREISDTVPKKIVQSSAALLTTLIKLECKTNNMKQAQKLFKSLTNPTEVTYTVLLSGFIEAEMYEEADKLVAMINRHYSLQLQVTLIALYLKTKRYERAAEIYDTVHKSKLFEDPTTCAILLSLFSETSQQKYAEEIINAVGKQIVPNARLISSLIHYECKRKNLDKAMQLFLDMRSQKFEPSAITYVLMISTFVDAQRFSDVEKIANFMQQDNIKPSVELMNTMIKYKVKIKNLNKALEIFHTMCERTKPSIVTYNILLSGCIENNQYSKAQELYHQIQSQDLNVELYTTLIKLECRMNNVTKALELLQSMKDKGMNPDAATYTVLINNLPIQYDSIIDGLVDQAIKIEPSSELCSTIIKMYFSRNMEREGFTFFKKYVWNSNVASIDIIMQLFSCVDANQFVYDLKQEIYRKAHRNKFDNCVLMLCAAREYDISLVESMFQATTHKDIDFYNCLLYAYKSTGKGEKAVQILETMKDSVEPNSSSYLMVLTACSHSKLVTQARSIYDQLVNEHRVTDVHTNCMIDTYARAGNFVEAEKLVPHGKDNTIAWSSILGGCKIYSNVKLAEKATKLLEHDSSSYVMMGNIYGSQGMWQEQHQIRSLMDERKLSKIPGKSTIQIGEKFVSYVVEDNTATKEEIAYLKQLREAITLIGYEPDVSCVLKELPSHEAKVEHLWQHSEKLALAAGLLHTSDKINITKNLRMCLDCHEATKMISRVTQREIVIWDASRAHQFINGKCDCGDIY
jgi:pentatricopeptide repeat protein